MRHPVVVVLIAALAATAGAQWLEAQLGIPDTMPWIAGGDLVLFRPDNHHAYVAGYDLFCLQILDYTARTKVRRIVIDDYVRDMVYCADRGRMYLLGNDRMLVLDGYDSLIGEVSLPHEPVVGLYNQRLQRVYAAMQLGGVCVIDPGPDTVLSQVYMADPLINGVLDSASGRAFLLSNHGQDSAVFVLDCGPDTLLRRLPTPSYSCTALELNSATRRLYCLGTDGVSRLPEVWVYDTDSLTVVATIALPESWEHMQGALLLNPEGCRLYAYWTDWSPERDDLYDSIAVINTADNSVRGFIETPSASLERRMFLNPANNKAYMTFDEHGEVAVLGSPDTITGWIEIGNGTSCAAWNPYNNEVLIPNYSGFLYFVSGSSDSIVARMDYSDPFLYTLTWTPAGNKLYASWDGGIAVVGSDNRVRKIVSNDRFSGRRAYSPQLNRLYFAWGFSDSAWVFDCNTDTFVSVQPLPLPVDLYAPPFVVPNHPKVYVPSESGAVMVYSMFLDSVVAVKEGLGTRFCHNPRTGRVYGDRNWYTISVIDPSRDSTTSTIRPCPTQNMTVNSTDNLLYTTDGSSRRIYVVDLESNSLTDTITLSEPPMRLAWYEPLDKLYAFGDSAVYSFDCRNPGEVKTIDDIRTAWWWHDIAFSDRNDKLWVGSQYGIHVIQCRTDSQVAYFPAVDYNVRLVWNSIDNRIYVSQGNRVFIYRDDPIGVAEKNPKPPGSDFRLQANPASGSARFALPPQTKRTLAIRDVAGRLVWQTQVPSGRAEQTWPGIDLNGRRVPAGIYFAALEPGIQGSTLKVILR